MFRQTTIILRWLYLVGLTTFLFVNQIWGQVTQPDSVRLRSYVQRADTLYQQEKHDSLLAFTQRVIPLSAGLPRSKYQGRLYYYLAMVYRHQRNLSKTLGTLQKALAICRQTGDVLYQGKSMYVISTVYLDQGNYKRAIALCLSNLDFFKQQGLTILQFSTYDLLYNVYRDLGDGQRSENFLNESIQLIDRAKTPIERIVVYANVAQNMEDKGQYEEAWPYRESVVRMAKTMTSQKSYQIPCLLQAATNLRKRHRLKEAMRYLQDAADVAINLYDSHRGGHIYIEMALVNLEMGHIRKALWLAQSYLESIEKLHLSKDRALGLETLALAEEKLHHYQQALKAYKESHTIMDSLQTVEKMAQVTRIQTLYEVEKKENAIGMWQKKAQLHQLEAQQQEQRLTAANREKNLYLVGIGILASSMAVVGYFLRRLYLAKQLLTRKKREIESQAQQLQEINRLKDRLFAIVGHDLRSPVASLKASFMLLKMQNRYSSELTRLEEEVDGLSQILDNVLYWSLSQQNGLNPRPQLVSLDELVADALEGFAGFIRHKQLIVTFDAKPVLVWTDENMTMLVLRNILHNAFKFTASGGAVRISIITGPDQISVRITDTGFGMNLENGEINPQFTKGKGTGIGLSLSRELMQRNGGRLAIESQPGRGTSVTLSWPTPQPAQGASPV